MIVVSVCIVVLAPPELAAPASQEMMRSTRQLTNPIR